MAYFSHHSTLPQRFKVSRGGKLQLQLCESIERLLRWMRNSEYQTLPKVFFGDEGGVHDTRQKNTFRTAEENCAQ